MVPLLLAQYRVRWQGGFGQHVYTEGPHRCLPNIPFPGTTGKKSLKVTPFAQTSLRQNQEQQCINKTGKIIKRPETRRNGARSPGPASLHGRLEEDSSPQVSLYLTTQCHSHAGWASAVHCCCRGKGDRVGTVYRDNEDYMKQTMANRGFRKH